MNMYKILIVDESIDLLKKDEEQCIDYAKIGDLELKLKNQEYDLIYLSDSLVKDNITENVLYDYRIRPSIFEKLFINKSKYTIFINQNIINKLIMDNIGIIEYKNTYEEFVIASIIEEKILKDMKLEPIYKKICPDKKHMLNVKNVVKNVIERHYVGDSFYRKLGYIVKQERIQEKFFSKILKNIENDIINRCNDDELSILANVAIAIFPSFQKIVEEQN
ncbi:MAG: hypothetical protein HFJ19_00295 [Clostridia bacterium]|nr:hypothetical protein [Clostridia bacterium]